MIPITKISFDEADLASIQEPLRAGWIVQGRFVKEFEALFARKTGAQHAVATTSCTTALHLALAALGIQPGDEVLVPAFTWVSTANCVEYMRATPIFVDVDPETYNISPTLAAASVTPRTRAMIPVHLFGLSADMVPLMALAADRGIAVVEDAACGFDSWYRGRHVGTFGNAGCFSFHPRKAITTGEGGMLTTNDAALAALCRAYRDHGATRSDLDRHEHSHAFLLADYPHLGFNYRMTDMQGALGVSQLLKATAMMAARHMAAARYDHLLERLPWLRRPKRDPDYVHGHQAYVCTFAPEKPTLENWERLERVRNDIMGALESEGISTRQGTHAPPFLGFYRQKYRYEPRDFPHAFLAEHTTISLPLYPRITPDEQEQVVSGLSRWFDKLWCRREREATRSE